MHQAVAVVQAQAPAQALARLEVPMVATVAQAPAQATLAMAVAVVAVVQAARAVTVAAMAATAVQPRAALLHQAVPGAVPAIPAVQAITVTE